MGVLLSLRHVVIDTSHHHKRHSRSSQPGLDWRHAVLRYSRNSKISTVFLNTHGQPVADTDSVLLIILYHPLVIPVSCVPDADADSMMTMTLLVWSCCHETYEILLPRRVLFGVTLFVISWLMILDKTVNDNQSQWSFRSNTVQRRNMLTTWHSPNRPGLHSQYPHSY